MTNEQSVPTARWRMVDGRDEEVDLICDECGLDVRAAGPDLHRFRGMLAEWHYKRHFSVP